MTEAGFAWIVISAAAAGLLARSRYERSHFVTERVFVVSPKLPDGYRKQLVFLTDLHDNRFGRGNETLLAAIGRIAPDAVLIGGDMMVAKGRADLTVTEELVKSLAARWPVYYGNGNHEERMNRERDVYGDAYDRLVVFLRETGVHYLSDESCDLDCFVRISGCNLDETYYRHRFSIPRLPRPPAALALSSPSLFGLKPLFPLYTSCPHLTHRARHVPDLPVIPSAAKHLSPQKAAAET